MSTAGITETQILENVIMANRPGGHGMSPELAHLILEFRFDPTAINRMNELAEKNRQGTLTETERQDMDKYIRVGNFLNLMQAMARLSLQRCA
jgi:hypothetical protein